MINDLSIFNSSNEDVNLVATKQDIKNIQSGMVVNQVEPGIVLDIVLDDTHPMFSSGKLGTISNPTDHIPDINGDIPTLHELDYTTIGVALIRLCYSQRTIEKEQLIYAYPLDSSVLTIPLLNEVVDVIKHFGKYYYTSRINTRNISNSSADFRYEQTYGKKVSNREYRNDDNTFVEFIGPKSTLRKGGGLGYEGALGRYFWFNKNIRHVKRYEGDTVIESRFGQSVRFSSYDENRNNDIGEGEDYQGDGNNNPFSNVPYGGGNPMILIRNRQRPVDRNNPKEKNVGSYIREDINNDGSSIHMTSGKTTSKYSTSCLKAYFSSNINEEQPKYSPGESTMFRFPTLNGDQMILNSDRIIISSKKNETMHFSKKRYMVVTDSEYTVDAQDQIVLTTNKKTTINSPSIYLGEYNQSSEPVLLGQTTIEWLGALCDWLIEHVHVDSPGNTGQSTTTSTVATLKDELITLLSKRVFITGGGHAPGADGGALKR